MSKLAYAALGVAVLALAVAIAAAAQRPQTGATATVSPPTVVAKFRDATAPYAGYVRVPVGWVFTDSDVLLHIYAAAEGGEVYGVYVDGVKYGNPALVTLAPGNHTVEVFAYVPGRTQIKVEYRVVT